jgi:hypothetical protein
VVRPPTLTTTGLREEDIVSSAERLVRRHQQRQIDRAVAAAHARLADDPSARAVFVHLLGVVRRRGRGLLGAALTGERHPGLDALEQLARAGHRYVRAVGAWPESHASWPGVVQSLSSHLLARYPVPAFLAASWYADDPWADAQRRWFVAHASGRPFRSLDLPFAMTRRMEHHFLRSPAHLSVPIALRRAELLGLGGDTALVEAIVTTRPASSLEQGEFWQTAWRFLIANRKDLALAEIAPLVDFFDGIRHEPIVVETPSSLEQRPPQEPGFSLKGRTVPSVRRLMHEWHRSLGRTASAARWTPSTMQPMRLEFPHEDPRVPPTVWFLVELTSAAELRLEGSALRHCVATFVRRCVNGDSRIWSLRRQHGDGPARSVLTIEVDPRRHAIVQLRGWCNRLPDGRPFQIVQRWASRERLRILRW